VNTSGRVSSQLYGFAVGATMELGALLSFFQNVEFTVCRLRGSQRSISDDRTAVSVQ
jgi:hypothetical protein